MRLIRVGDRLDGIGRCVIEFGHPATVLLEKGAITPESAVDVHMGYKDDCGRLFGDAVAKIGVNDLFFVLSLFGLKKASIKHTTRTIAESKPVSGKWTWKRIEKKEFQLTRKYATYKKSYLKKLEKIENFTESAIEHIFEGNINKKGNAGGYHYECIEDSPGRIISGTEVQINDLGVYKAQVKVNTILKSGNGGYSTFFPKDMSPQMIIDSINEAYNTKVFKVGNEYYGYANNGLKITMYINQNGKIISAFPAK